MASVLLSRVLGFFRDWTVAHQIGSNGITDAYYAAFTLPDFLNYLVAGGSLSLTFIPVFTKFVAENHEDEGWHVFSTVITVMGALLAGVILLGEIFAPHLVNLIAPGFSPAGESSRDLSDPLDAPGANLLLSRQHFERGAIREKPVRGSVARSRHL